MRMTKAHMKILLNLIQIPTRHPLAAQSLFLYTYYEYMTKHMYICRVKFLPLQ